jgi:hypothetical protein
MTNRQIYISKLKPVKDNIGLIKIRSAKKIIIFLVANPILSSYASKNNDKAEDEKKFKTCLNNNLNFNTISELFWTDHPQKHA